MPTDAHHAYDMAREILGQDFIYPEMIHRVIPFYYGEDQIRHMLERFPARGDLVRCRERNALLIAGAPRPTSLLEIRDLEPNLFFNKSGGWWSEPGQKFSRHDKVNPEWLMLCKSPVKRQKRSISWMERMGIISHSTRTPNAAEVAWVILLVKKIYGTWLFPDLHAGTSSTDSGGNRVFVGFSLLGGIGVNCSWGVCCLDSMGIVVALKQDEKRERMSCGTHFCLNRTCRF